MDETTRARGLAQIARPQGGCYTKDQAVLAGYPVSVINSRVRSGELAVILPSTYAPSVLPVDYDLRLRALRIYVEDGVVSHASAARRWGFPGYADNDELHVITGVDRPIRIDAPDVVVHRHVLRPDEIVVHDGQPTTTPERTIRDLAAHHWPKWLAVVAADACCRGLTSVDELRGRIVPGARGAARLRAVVDQLQSRPLGRNRTEGRFQGLFVGAVDLPMPIFNAVRTLHDGRVTEFDTLWEPERVVNEFDGPAFHSLDVDRQRDASRDATALRSGYDVRRWGPEAFDHPDLVIADTRARLAAARIRLGLPTT